jgi:uncharacterized membrane protein YebE (DUF533 family)
MTAAGVAWGIYESMQRSGAQGAGAATPAPPPGATGGVPPLPGAPAPLAASVVPPEVLRIIRLAVSAARADGVLSGAERALILERARDAGVDHAVEAELAQPLPLADIVRGLTDGAARRDLYRLAFTIVRADEFVSGAERIYLAQLASYLGLDAAAVAGIEGATATAIDAVDLPPLP